MNKAGEFADIVDRTIDMLGVKDVEVLRRSNVSRQSLWAWRHEIRKYPSKNFRRMTATLIEMLEERREELEQRREELLTEIRRVEEVKRDLQEYAKTRLPFEDIGIWERWNLQS